MTVNAVNAANAYNATSKLSGVQPNEISTLGFEAALEEAKRAMDSSFSIKNISSSNTDNNISRLLSSTFDQINISEQVNSQALKGQASTADVVTHITKAEAALQTISVARERIVEALKSLLQMSI
jgi:flagellar hook-basal body complex protein FliE